jgi:transcriptional regulator with XRE-family HTH domain
MKFGEYLKQQREHRGWTQPVAAEKLGIEQSYLSKLETGKGTPSEEMFERLAKGYQIDMQQLSRSVSLGELERLREIAAVRDLVRQQAQAATSGRRRWLMASLLMLTLGGATLSLVVTERRYADTEQVYVSAGVVRDGESDFLFAAFDSLEPRYIVMEHADDPLSERLDLVYRKTPEHRGAYFIEPAEGGRRVFTYSHWEHEAPRLNGHIGHALAVALLLGGLGGLFVARRW